MYVTSELKIISEEIRAQNAFLSIRFLLRKEIIFPYDLNHGRNSKEKNYDL